MWLLGRGFAGSTIGGCRFGSWKRRGVLLVEEAVRLLVSKGGWSSKKALRSQRQSVSDSRWKASSPRVSSCVAQSPHSPRRCCYHHSTAQTKKSSSSASCPPPAVQVHTSPHTAQQHPVSSRAEVAAWVPSAVASNAGSSIGR
jgi:hypothetical protein